MPRKKLKQISETEPINTVNSDNSLNTPKNISDNQTNTNDEDIIEISQLRGKEIWHYSMLEKFFISCELPVVQKMVDIINGNHLISLRFMDWFVTRYCYLYKTTINVTNKFCSQNNFNINISYKAQLKSFTKKYFDPFKRKKKFIYTLDKYKISFLTTLGQLNFFRWAITNDIINYTETNYKTIISKYDYVNSFFTKHSSTSSSNSSLTSNVSGSNNKSDSPDNNSMINKIYENNNSTIIIENSSKKSTYNLPRVSRNICIEL
jgi:hypothetical protein